MVESKACQVLVNEVIRKGLCTFCGACVGMCPYLVAHNGRVILKDTCNLPQGRCTTYCPRISIDLDKINRTIFGVPYTQNVLGTVKGVFMARPADADVKAKAQDSGIVTTLIHFAMDKGLIDSAILTLFEDKSLPKGVMVSTKDEILACAGSSYMATTTLEAFNREAQDNDRKKIGLVGTPCQVLALSRMKGSTLEERNNIDKLELVIGLFCTWALSCPDFAHFLEREVPDRIIKYDIPPHPANVLHTYTENGKIDIPLDKITPFIMPACRLCYDMTAEFADISVGSGRGEVLEWNTIIVRTERGMKLFDDAKNKGLIDVRDIPPQNLSRLEKASYNKKKRALKNIVERTGTIEDLLYLKLQPETVKQLLKEPE